MQLQQFSSYDSLNIFKPRDYLALKKRLGIGARK